MIRQKIKSRQVMKCFESEKQFNVYIDNLNVHGAPCVWLIAMIFNYIATDYL